MFNLQQIRNVKTEVMTVICVALTIPTGVFLSMGVVRF